MRANLQYFFKVHSCKLAACQIKSHSRKGLKQSFNPQRTATCVRESTFSTLTVCSAPQQMVAGPSYMQILILQITIYRMEIWRNFWFACSNHTLELITKKFVKSQFAFSPNSCVLRASSCQKHRKPIQPLKNSVERSTGMAFSDCFALSQVYVTAICRNITLWIHCSWAFVILSTDTFTNPIFN